MGAVPAVTPHDEYWHDHIDKETYPSFHYTSLLYLSEYKRDFAGGRFMFIDEGSKLNRSIEPKDGRVSAFTSGPENRHMVEPVTGGTRGSNCRSWHLCLARPVNKHILELCYSVLFQF